MAQLYHLLIFSGYFISTYTLPIILNKVFNNIMTNYEINAEKIIFVEQ